MEIIEKMTHKQVDQMVMIMVILVILMNMKVEIMEVM